MFHSFCCYHKRLGTRRRRTVPAASDGPNWLIERSLPQAKHLCKTESASLIPPERAAMGAKGRRAANTVANMTRPGRWYRAI